MHAPGDVRVEDRADPTIIDPTDAIIRLSATCICGSDLWPYRGAEPVEHQVMGHEYVGVVEQIGDDVRTIKVGDFVVGSFWASDNTCEICRAGYQAYCTHRILMGTIGTQSDLARIPLADGTLVATPGMPDPDLIPSLMAASDVLGTGWFAAVAAEAGPGKTVAVVGDGAVGLLSILAARQLGAERIVAVSRHADRQALAREFGATDIVEERGEDGVAKVKELTDGLGAHSVIEAVGTQEAMMQAIQLGASRRPRRVRRGLPRRRHPRRRAVHGRRPPPWRPGTRTSIPPRARPAHLGPQDRPRQGLRPHPPSRQGGRRLRRDGPAHRDQGAADTVSIAPTVTMPGVRRVVATTLTLTATLTLGACANDSPTTAAREPAPNREAGAGATQDTSPTPQETAMQLVLTVDGQRLTATLDDTPAARDLLAQLPLTIDMVDHGGVEKTGPLPQPLSLVGQPAGADPDVGDLGYYAPGNDLVLYYGDQSYYPGIVVLGRLDGDAAGRIAATAGAVTTTVEAR